MIKRLLPLALCLLFNCSQKPQNVFSFCRDFDATGCISPVKDRATYSAENSIRNKTVREFFNSIYFRGDRLAFEIKQAHARWDMTFDCLHGYYYFGNDQAEKHELDYLELREKNVYGLVMIGSMIEKKFSAIKQRPYKPLPPFTVTYAAFCGKDPLASGQITVELN